jgi:hypothetical protein
MIDVVRMAFRALIRRVRHAIPTCRGTYHYRSGRPECGLHHQYIRV